MATRLKLQYLGVEWRLERRGMEWRLGKRATGNRGQGGGRTYVGSTWTWKEMGMEKEEWDAGRSGECNGSRRRERAQERERDEDRIVRECHGMSLEREGFDGNKLRS